jgi:hypothetical protein
MSAGLYFGALFPCEASGPEWILNHHFPDCLKADANMYSHPRGAAMMHCFIFVA